MQRYQNSLHFKFSPISVEGGGVIENQFFAKFKKVQIILGEGGGVKKIMVFFILNPTLRINYLAHRPLSRWLELFFRNKKTDQTELEEEVTDKLQKIKVG